MVSKAKLYSQLDLMENELLTRIVPHLEKAASGANDLVFCASDFNPFPELKFRTDTETDSLVQLGRKVLALREKLGEPSEGSIAERICWYCRAWGNTRDSYRRASQELAREFLKEVSGASAKT